MKSVLESDGKMNGIELLLIGVILAILHIGGNITEQLAKISGQLEFLRKYLMRDQKG